MADVRIPDLDPRADAHLWGPITLQIGMVLAAWWAVCGLLYGLLAIVFHGWAALVAAPLAVGGTMWTAADGPSRWWRHQQWRQRPRTSPAIEGPPGLAARRPPASHAADSIWVADGTCWALAMLVIPPIETLDDAEQAAWHQRLAETVRLALTHGVVVDLLAAQMPGPAIAPTRTVTDPVLAARWRWWATALGPHSIQSAVWIRLGLPTTDRNAAWPHFEAVEQAWLVTPGPGTWHWLSATAAWQVVEDAANPPAAYQRWVRQVTQATGLGHGALRRKRFS